VGAINNCHFACSFFVSTESILHLDLKEKRVREKEETIVM